MRYRPDQSFVGIDLNATRVRAAAGSASGARALALDGEQAALPLYLSLERRHAEVGRAGLALCRRLPHVVCGDFLASLGKPRVWQAGRHTLDAAQAMAVVFKHLTGTLGRAEAVVLAVPSYLTRPQGTQLFQLAEQARWPVAGALAAPLAAALAALQQQPWTGPGLVVDVDDHALTLTMLVAAEDRVQTLEREALPHLSLRAWKERLLDAVAERCIRRSRRDPRESSEAEQALFEQLDGAFHACAAGRLADVTLQAGQWYQDMVLRPEEIAGACSRLVGQVRTVLRDLAQREVRQTPAAVVLTASASQLPGLAAALQDLFARPATLDAEPEPSDDFGENLLPVPLGETVVLTLPEDAVARTACALAAAFQNGQLPQGYLDTAAPFLGETRPPAAPRRFGTIG